MKYDIDFSVEKNLLLKITRGVCFNDVIDAINKDKIIDDLKHHTKKNQRILVVKLNNYIYAVAYVIDNKRKVIFLKTIYPSRILNKKYLKKE